MAEKEKDTSDLAFYPIGRIMLFGVNLLVSIIHDLSQPETEHITSYLKKSSKYEAKKQDK